MIGASIIPDVPAPDTFNATLWLNALTSIGGGYALTADRRLCLMVADCDAADLAPLTAQLVGNAERQEALRIAIELRQVGDC